jgi:hypothetical protein
MSCVILVAADNARTSSCCETCETALAMTYAQLGRLMTASAWRPTSSLLSGEEVARWTQ